MLIATTLVFIAVLILGARQRRRLRRSGRQMGPGHAPVWGLPLILAALVGASAAAAYVAS
jgi:hypothetical protein